MDKKPISTLVIGLGGSGAWVVAHVKRQLMDAYGNDVPDNVSLVVMDTDKAPTIGIGGKEIIREPGMGFGRVEVKPSEYVHVGGNAKAIAQRIDSDYPQMKSWFQAKWHLGNLEEGLWNLESGAGQYRQLGRLAFFKDTLNPAQSRIAQILVNRFSEMAIRNPDRAISVMVVGSLVGGTGAGLFIDVPYLVRRVAELGGFKLTLRAFYVLPEAFIGTLDAGEITRARQRTFAAMRELSRFLMNETWQYGYPMPYHAPGTGSDDKLWRANQMGKLYDYVYLMDGEGTVHLNSRKFDQGTASAVADAIVTFIDESYGPVRESLDNNLNARANTVQAAIGRQAMVRSLGTYSIILPVQQMIETWAYQLGHEVMLGLVPGSRHDDHDYVLQLSHTDDPLTRNSQPKDEVMRLLRDGTPLPDPRGRQEGGKTLEIQPLALWKAIYNFYEKLERSEDGAIRELTTYDRNSWLQILVPGQLAADRRTQDAMGQASAVLSRSIYDAVLTSDKRKPNNPESDWRSIRNETDIYITGQLGIVGAGGGRLGGQYGDALQRFVTLQAERFSEYLSAYMMHTLNGTLTSQEDRIAAKQGKLGRLLKVLEELRRVFARVSDLLEKVRSGGNVNESVRASRLSSFQQADKEMVAKAQERDLLKRPTPAIKAQESYLARAQDYVDFYRTEFARNAVADASKRVIDILDQTIDDLNSWREALATSTDSLYARLLDGYRRVINERRIAGEIENHFVIGQEDDEKDKQQHSDWEKRKFEAYVERDNARLQIYNGWNWETQIDPTTGRVLTSARLGETQLRKDQRKRWAEDNLDAMLKLARKIFEPALERESVVDYLMNEKFYNDEDGLGDFLYNRAGILLTLNTNATTATRTTTLLARYNEKNKDKAEETFLKNVGARIAAKFGAGDTTKVDNALHNLAQCSDPFRLTLLTTGELIPLRSLKSYETARELYQPLPYDSRQILHIFPAEVRAVEYEAKLHRLKQKQRPLTDRIAVLLENEQRFKQFLQLYAHRIISEARNRNNDNQIEWLYTLSLTSGQNGRSKVDYWWLTMPTSKDELSLLDAMITFVMLTDDIRAYQKGDPQYEGFTHEIPRRRVLEALRQARVDDTVKRVGDDNLAIQEVIRNDNGEIVDVIYDDDLRSWIEAFMPPLVQDPETGEMVVSSEQWTDEKNAKFYEVAELVVRHDILREQRDRLLLEMPAPEVDTSRRQPKGFESFDDELSNQPLSGQAHDAARRRQEEIDLYSIAWIALDNEITNLRHAVQQEFDQFTHR